jgi:PRC-barrel domain
VLDRGARCPDFRQMPLTPRGTTTAVAALLLMAAAQSPPPSNVQRVPPEQALAILGHTDPSGKTIGRLVDVLVDNNGDPQAAVIDFGGFMGVGSRKIAVQWSTLHFAPANSKQPITLDLSQDQIKAAPEFKDTTKPAPVVVAPDSSSH